MDLYEAIEIVDEWLRSFDGIVDWDSPAAELLQAVKICLEAARDKAGV